MKTQANLDKANRRRNFLLWLAKNAPGWRNTPVQLLDMQPRWMQRDFPSYFLLAGVLLALPCLIVPVLLILFDPLFVQSVVTLRDPVGRLAGSRSTDWGQYIWITTLLVFLGGLAVRKLLLMKTDGKGIKAVKELTFPDWPGIGLALLIVLISSDYKAATGTSIFLDVELYAVGGIAIGILLSAMRPAFQAVQFRSLFRRTTVQESFWRRLVLILKTIACEYLCLILGKAMACREIFSGETNKNTLDEVSRVLKPELTGGLIGGVVPLLLSFGTITSQNYLEAMLGQIPVATCFFLVYLAYRYFARIEFTDGYYFNWPAIVRLVRAGTGFGLILVAITFSFGLRIIPSESSRISYEGLFSVSLIAGCVLYIFLLYAGFLDIIKHMAIRGILWWQFRLPFHKGRFKPYFAQIAGCGYENDRIVIRPREFDVRDLSMAILSERAKEAPILLSLVALKGQVLQASGRSLLRCCAIAYRIGKTGLELCIWLLGALKCLVHEADRGLFMLMGLVVILLMVVNFEAISTLGTMMAHGFMMLGVFANLVANFASGFLNQVENWIYLACGLLFLSTFIGGKRLALAMLAIFVMLFSDSEFDANGELLKCGIGDTSLERGFYLFDGLLFMLLITEFLSNPLYDLGGTWLRIEFDKNSRLTGIEFPHGDHLVDLPILRAAKIRWLHDQAGELSNIEVFNAASQQLNYTLCIADVLKSGESLCDLRKGDVMVSVNGVCPIDFQGYRKLRDSTLHALDIVVIRDGRLTQCQGRLTGKFLQLLPMVIDESDIQILAFELELFSIRSKLCRLISQAVMSTRLTCPHCGHAGDSEA